MAPISQAQQKSVAKYKRENYEQINLSVKKGRKAEIKAAADASGESLNKYIEKAVYARMGKTDY